MRLDGETVPSPASLELRPIVTLDEGSVLSTTEKKATPPASVVTSPEVGVTVIMPPSLSRLVTETSATTNAL